jgi:nucleoid-associated protein YgaU
MIKRIVGGLVLMLLVSMSGTALAAEKKMTRDDYKAQLAEYTQREQQAGQEIDALNPEIADLEAQLNGLEGDISQLDSDILSLVDATEVEVKAFGRQLDSIIGQLEGLMALAPEVLIQRRGELDALKDQVAQLKKSKISTIPEMQNKLGRIDAMVDQLSARVAQPVTIDYMVEKGDNLWNISKKDDIYADPYMWPRIYRANKEQIDDPDLIFPDQKLAVPFGVAENQYLVTRGDFLFKIAAQVYNDPGKWHKIYEANKQQIVEPHLIFPAQVLEVPGN